MTRKLTISTLLLLLVHHAQAATLFNDEASWAAAVGGSYFHTDNYGPAHATTNMVSLNGGGDVSLNNDTPIYGIGDGWATWSGGYTGQVLFNASNRHALTLNFGSGIRALGFYAEPDPFKWVSFTATLNDGSTLKKSIYGASGADFFGFTGAVTSLKLNAGSDFAIGQFVSSPTTIPLPGAVWLFGSAVAGLGYFGKRRLTV